MLPLVPPPSKVTQLFKSCGKTPGSCFVFYRRTHSRGKNVMMFFYHHSIALKTRLLLIQCGADSVVVSLRQYSFAMAIYVPAPFETPFGSVFWLMFVSQRGSLIWVRGSEESVSAGQPTTLGPCHPA